MLQLACLSSEAGVSMRFSLQGALARLTPGGRDRRNIAALADRLGVPSDDAAWIYRRSRRDGFGVAMQAWEERCRERAAAAAEPHVETSER